MSPQALLGILSKNNLMDASMLMDFGALYWTTSDDHTRQLIRTMFRDVVSLDLTKYNSQFADIALGLIALIERFHEKLIGEQKSVLTKSRLIRLAYSVLDFSVTVSSLISCYPPVGRIFHENNLTARMISFHDSFFPQLQDQIKEKFSELESDFPSLNPNEDSGSDNVTFEDIKQIVLYSKQFTVLSVREIAISSCLDPLLDESIPVERKAVFFDSLIEVFTFAVTLKHFYEDYSTNYPVQKDISILAMNPHSGFSRIDPTRIEYLSKLLQDQVAESKDKELLNSYVDLQNDVQAEKSKRKKEKKAARKQTAMTSNIEKSATKDGNMGGEGGIDEVEMVSLISGIKDILPDLGEGFIELCLESFGYNNELTLNALLMDDLPDDVKGLSKQLTRQDVKGIRAITERRKSQDVTSSAPAIIVPDVIASRANIFDGDEFDIYRNKTIDFSRVHIGKKDVESVSIDDDVKKKTLLLQEKMRQEKEDEELRLMAELGITDPDDFYIG
jgi:activating signal cointegrator complex subunit 2